MSPPAFPHLLAPETFLPVNSILQREAQLLKLQELMRQEWTDNKAIVIQGKPGSGKTAMAVFAATHCSTANTCVHFFNHQSINSKQFNLSIIESPSVPLCCLQRNPRRSITPASFQHIVILDDIVDLKHHLEIKSLVNKLDQSGRRQPRKTKKVLYLFIVDRPESRVMSARMQSIFQYTVVQSPNEDQCLQVARLHQSHHPSFAHMGNLSTLFAAIRSFKLMMMHRGEQEKEPANLPYCITHRVAEHEKEVVMNVFRRIFVDKQEIRFIDQRALLQNSDVRNVSLHYLENLPLALQDDPRIEWADKHHIYVQSLRVLANSDFTDYELFQHERSASSNLNSTGNTATTSSFSAASGNSGSYSSSASPASSSGVPSQNHQHHQVQKEMLQYLRLGATSNIALTHLRKSEREAEPITCVPWRNARELEFSKLNTKYSMQQSEKWFMTLLSIRLGIFNVAEFIVRCCCSSEDESRAPLESESTEIWRRYLQGHPFFADKIHLLSFNDFRHLFRFLYMHIGALTTQSGRMQLSDDEWSSRTCGLLGKASAAKRKRKLKNHH